MFYVVYHVYKKMIKKKWLCVIKNIFMDSYAFRNGGIM